MTSEATPSSTSALGLLTPPALDLAAPERVETATFALG